MELKPNMYVRTKEGYICKILKLNEPFEDDGYLDHNDIGSSSIQQKNILKASYNIIDLIEVGDYVNGCYIQEIKSLKDNVMVCMLDSDYEFVSTITNKEIRTIVTKEQFESMSYKVGE